MSRRSPSRIASPLGVLVPGLQVLGLRVPALRVPALRVLGLLIFGLTFGAPDARAEDPRTIIADRTLLPDGTLAPGLAVVLAADGTIEGVVPSTTESLPLPKIEFGPGSVLTPGLHELLSSIGAPGETEETIEPFDIFASARVSIDPLRRDLDRARLGGVLHATVAPDGRNPISGRSVTFVTGASPTLKEITAAPHGPFVCAVGESALDPNRDPTSRSGLRLAFEAWLEAGGRALFANDTQAGVAAPLVHCTEAMDVRTALDLFTERFPTLILASGSTEAAALLARSGIGRGEPIVVGPYTTKTPIPEIQGATKLTDSGFELAFRGGMPEAGEESLRDSARRAVSRGLDPAAARRAMTVNPARVVGLERILGSIAPGCRADLAVFTGDPLLAPSQAVAVFERGVQQSIVEPSSTDISEIPHRQETRR